MGKSLTRHAKLDHSMVVGRALDGGCRALGEVSAHPRSVAEDAKNAADGG